ncbi:Hypothetical protein CINCED_3A003480 [Cinara cedri]|uniref:Uncharacterized protein n=1 Tax=Cinara cedri TaxID=506608 RepID=A0A5E4MDG7_9HEMI|nr:Hypothetical protein CINCED_3A003480 [Cinara cedri]
MLYEAKCWNSKREECVHGDGALAVNDANMNKMASLKEIISFSELEITEERKPAETTVVTEETLTIQSVGTPEVIYFTSLIEATKENDNNNSERIDVSKLIEATKENDNNNSERIDVSKLIEATKENDNNNSERIDVSKLIGNTRFSLK